MNINEITMGLTPQEKDIYFKHMERNHRYEQEKIEMERKRNSDYKKWLIDEILTQSANFGYDELNTYSVKTLEVIYDKL